MYALAGDFVCAGRSGQYDRYGPDAAEADLVDELFKRGKEATIPVGKYIIGQHIPAGDYVIMAGVSSGTWVEVNDEPGGYGDHYQLHDLKAGESVGLVVLRDGDTLDVKLGEANFTALSGIMFNFK